MSSGAWTFRVSREKSSDFFIHVLLLLIGESLTETLSEGSLALFSKTNVDDDICGVSLSVRFSSNLVTVWNRMAPGSLPTSASTPHSGRLPFSPNSPTETEDGEISPVERGVEKMKDAILVGLPKEVIPQSWYYKVLSLRIIPNGRFIVPIETSKAWEGKNNLHYPSCKKR